MCTTDPHRSSRLTIGRRPRRRRPIRFGTLALLGLVAAFGGCSGSGQGSGEDSGLDGADPSLAADVPVPGTIVDSILPIEEEIRRFRTTVSEAPDRLDGGAASRDELVSRFVAAVEAADTLALRDLLMTQAEFAYLYYPHTMYTRPPYELSPALLWFQIETGTSQGFSRMMQAFAGRPLEWTGYRCAPEPGLEAENRVWQDCRILLAPAEGEPSEAALFGSILERSGVFKFVSYSNEL